MQKAEKLILVDENDNAIGVETKEKCHLKQGLLHRAFTIFIFNQQGQLLIQKRSKNKLLWPFYWEASCSSHPWPNEEMLEAGKRKLKDELGFSCPLVLFDKFNYKSHYKDIGTEHEVCSLLIGQYDKDIKFDNKEVQEIKWIYPTQLKEDIVQNPQNYAPWLKIALKIWQEKK